MTVSAVILAAGRARRAGGPKTVWPVGGLPAVRRVALAALGAARVDELIVGYGGPWAGEVRSAREGRGLSLVLNPEVDRGQASSLTLGLAAADPASGAALFLLADQPFITSQIIDDLLIFHERSRASLAAPLYKGRRRNPAVFSLAAWRKELMGLTGDQGARALIEGRADELALWPADGLPEECFADFDTFEEYESLTRGFSIDNTRPANRPA